MTMSYSQDLIIGDELMSHYELINKKRKLKELYDLYWRPYCITDLAIEPLTHVASFLAPPSRALFAIALYGSRRYLGGDFDMIESTQSCSWWDHSRRRSIRALMGNKCDNLDFGDIEESLAARIDDADLVMILFCFGVNEIKKLRLSNCILLEGVGLWPLRRSNVMMIEQIDLSVVTGYTNSKLWKEAQDNYFSNENVFRTLLCIIHRPDNALKHIQLHWSCRGCWLMPRFVDSFITDYNNMLARRGITSCSKCTINLTTRDDAPQIGYMELQLNNDRWTEIESIQRFTCSNCLRIYCHDCQIGHNDTKGILDYCSDCERFTCQDCCKQDFCAKCELGFCEGTCGGLKESRCRRCMNGICAKCVFESTCVRCNGIDCGKCDDDIYVMECTVCLRNWCTDCLFLSDQCYDCDGYFTCDECISERKCNQCKNTFCGDCRSISECKLCKQRCCSDCDPSREWGRDERNGYCAECANKQADS